MIFRARPAGLENDEYVRKTDGYLPTAEVAFIDEIFKANSAILNALLTLLNERLFDNGNKRYKVPLLCLVRTSFKSHPRCVRDIDLSGGKAWHAVAGMYGTFTQILANFMTFWPFSITMYMPLSCCNS